MSVRPTIYSRLYRDFLAIEPKNYHAVIRFYEEWEAQIGQLEDDQHYELLFSFTHALFEVGAYRQFLSVVDQAILVALDPAFRPDQLQQQEEFELLLFRKSAAYLQILEPARAEHIARELTRINPQHKFARLLLQKSLRQQNTGINLTTRAFAILLFGLSALIILIEVLVIRSFYNMYTVPVEWSRNLIFLAGLLVLGLGELLTFWRAYRQTKQFVQKSKNA
jgi:tetratricopeptide (TPR) repeat protein